ncbi:hypothetical protein XFF6166_670155 [Xanthomonas citri pv. fuscans]|nr:hypothetical protein XFF6166_670155 [Xanthomonas citri pv. fuscans]SOO01784.1 hypothetical protein XFF6960_520154 [Xanthomonas citri pv. fuscans]SOO04183.1 hypothetical protein XFF7767_240040 [Xanthomonas citri pv. fuscans]SOO09366.1 hypothetical protein XFF6970_340039 [Xanthomonas citri pv. fuscans]SOO16621.1 hypothetical protein XFF7766_850040 [Xanthomonas citri pv. fuscans]
MGMIHILNSRIGIYLAPLATSERYLRWKRVLQLPVQPQPLQPNSHGRDTRSGSCC